MQTVLLKTLLAITAYLPLWFAHLLGKLLGRLNWHLKNRHQKVASKNIELCFPELNAAEQKKLVIKSLQQTACTLTEMGIIWLGPLQRVLKLVKSVANMNCMQDALKQQRGVLLAVPHLGSWELVNLYLANQYPVTSLYKPAKLAALDQLIRKSRQRNGARLVPTDASGVRALSTALKNQELVLILPDQQPTMGNGVFADFFGRPAYTMTLLSRLAQKYHSPVIYAFAERLPGSSGFRLHFRPASENTYSDDITVSATAINQDIEAIAREFPEQYQWTYKRFKYRPEKSEKSPYSR